MNILRAPTLTLAIAFAATLGTLLAADFLWLHFVMKGIFDRELGDLVLDQPRLLPAGLFYIFFTAGLLIFAVIPAVNDGGGYAALVWGAILGFLAYGSYDLTNLATLRAWTWKLAVLDMLWGTFVSSLSALASTLAVQYSGARL